MQQQPVQQQAAEPPQAEAAPKIGAGAGAGAAFLRQGAKELAQVLPAFPSHGVQPVEEMGAIWGQNPTPQEVYRQKTGEAEAAPQTKATVKAAEPARQKQHEPEMG
ncbi:MAG: hypothetical protein C0501_21290 [Isosphaera sp.]|nr:hypothetical protein [Isosphaera sp.]